MDLKRFLSESKNNLIENDNLMICLGSMACDLDSFCSTLVFSYFKNLIPIMNISKEVFVCKDENLFVCEQIGIDCEDLIFVNNDQFEFKNNENSKKNISINEKQIDLYLVDENEPSKEFKNCNLILIIDHHEFYRVYDPRIQVVSSKTVSCASIISKEFDIPKEIRKHLFYPILFDTDNLTKCNEIDREQFEIICQENNFNSEFKQDILAGIKVARKKNEKNQPTWVLLRKDFKQYDNFGISSVRYRLAEWISRDGASEFKNEVCKFMDSQDIKYLFINFNCKIDKIRKRFLMIFPQDFDNFEIFDDIPKEGVYSKDGIKYYGISPDFSRKKIAPAIRKFFSLKKIEINSNIK